MIVEGDRNRLTFLARAISEPDSHGVDGDNLWRLSTYITSDPFSPEQRNFESQVLNPSQRGLPLTPGGRINFGSITVDVDLTGQSCDDSAFLCAELQKEPQSDVDFTLETQDRRPLISCEPLACTGKL